MDKKSTEQNRPVPALKELTHKPSGLEHTQVFSFRKWGVSKSGEALRVPSLSEVPQGSEDLGGTIPATALYGNPGEMAASVVHLVSAQ